MYLWNNGNSQTFMQLKKNLTNFFIKYHMTFHILFKVFFQVNKQLINFAMEYVDMFSLYNRNTKNYNCYGVCTLFDLQSTTAKM